MIAMIATMCAHVSLLARTFLSMYCSSHGPFLVQCGVCCPHPILSAVLAVRGCMHDSAAWRGVQQTHEVRSGHLVLVHSVHWPVLMSAYHLWTLMSHVPAYLDAFLSM